MNEFDRRLIAVAQNHMDLATLAQTMGPSALVEHFGYTLQIGSATDAFATGTPKAGHLAMQSDAYFFLQYVSSCVHYPDTSWWFSDSGGIQIQITDTGTGDVLYSQPSSAGSLTATISRAQPGVPLLLPVPRLLTPNLNVQVDVTQIGQSATATNADGFFLFLGGSRISQV